jgi:hypothetical protein
MKHLTTLLLAATIYAASAQENPAPAAPPAAIQPSVKKLDDARYKIGKITFDQKTREIRIPAKVNLQEGVLECLLVHENGKIHESLFSTDASPTHVNLAFTLLRYPPSRELYAIPNEHGGASNDYPEVPEEIKAAARVSIDVEWKDGEQLKRIPVNEWIQHNIKTTTMPAGPWVYGGSSFEREAYAPEISGDIIAIFSVESSIINYPGEDNRNDDVWVSHSQRVPAKDTEVTIIISPFSK